VLLHPGPQMRSRPKNRRSLVLHSRPNPSMHWLTAGSEAPCRAMFKGPRPTGYSGPTWRYTG